ncbi:hypothetical protein HYN59_09525 [Flavobacterium album]|uniref:DUF4199 domain-containing protein n=1 Tax=Flavobacterium album TaxID=2175091 RepID=A0A2S1QY54_9FLAO|nr:DUF4199 domain-containing protein [Flavobacterium album]AWH85340.1 hypothetical protein HYN59_09525 [Flavobacterium album]
MTNAVKKTGVNFGLIVGLVSIFSTTILYAIDVKLFVSWWVGIVLFFISLAIGIVAVAKAKSKLNGFITFKEAFTVYFITMAIGAAIGSIYMFILFNFIDTDAKAIVTDAVVEKTASMMQGMGVKSEDIRKTIEDIKASDSFGLVSQIKSYFGGLVMYTIIGLIVAVSMKKNKPEFQ